MTTPSTSTPPTPAAAPARPPLVERIAGAPISWGVCEVPGWGHQLDVDTVLGEMREVGIVATEFGPDGFLPEEPVEKADRLAEARLRAVGQFVPVVLHDAGHDPIPEVESAIEALTAAGTEPAWAAVRRAVPALLGRQRPDGTFGPMAQQERALIGLRALLWAERGP